MVGERSGMTYLKNNKEPVLLFNRLAADIGSVSSCDRGLGIVVVLIGIIVMRLVWWRLGCRAGRGSSDGVETMRAGDGSVGDAVNTTEGSVCHCRGRASRSQDGEMKQDHEWG